MTTEEKAKAYDKALETARKINSGEGVPAPPDWTICEVIFPELKESEGERIRKDLIKYLESDRDCQPCQDVSFYDSSIAWLEKQKEQKPAEWSEEDEKDMAHIIRILDDCYAYGKYDLSKTDHENLVNKLKSLRPQLKVEAEPVDLEKEIENKRRTMLLNLFGPMNGEQGLAIRNFARHFYELGRKGGSK